MTSHYLVNNNINCVFICMFQEQKQQRRRLVCGTCEACLCKEDCGSCDFCLDKPKFGGSNKKRQKCRLRQCQRQAMVGVVRVPESANSLVHLKLSFVM